MMDTSKEYIEMCWKAVEVQELWEPRFGDLYIVSNVEFDFIVLTYNNKTGIVQGINKEGKEQYFHIKSRTWLPRQDQLQGIIKNKIESDYGLQIRFIDFLDNFDFRKKKNSGDITETGVIRSMSMEQLWLAFVMKERWNKTWNGTEWTPDTAKPQ
jgi:hypothetical protein